MVRWETRLPFLSIKHLRVPLSDLLSAKTAPDLSRCLSSNFQRELNQNNHCNSHVEDAGQFFDQENFINISVTFLWPRYKVHPIVLTVSLLFMPLSPITFPNLVIVAIENVLFLTDI